MEGALPGADFSPGRFSDRVIFTIQAVIASLLIIPCVPLEGRMAVGERIAVSLCHQSQP